MSGTAANSKPRCISVVLPVFNESQAVQELFTALRDVFQNISQPFELIFVNDGSTDDSAEELDRLAIAHTEVRVVHFSRNFGHQAAVLAGLSQAKGEAIVVMDADFQDNPNAIPRMLEKWQAGFDVVYAVRVKRKENPLKRFLFYAFYRMINSISQLAMPMDAGNFGLIDRRVAREIQQINDRDRYYAGLRCWVGHRQIGIEVERGARYDKHPRVSFLGLFRLAKSAIFSFSAFPLAIFYGIALLALLAAGFCWGFVLYHKFITHHATPGWTSMVMVGGFFGFINALGIAVLGEYVWRIYDQVRARPPYIIDRITEKDQKSTPRETSDEK